MSDNALYVYGIVKFWVDLNLNEEGLTGKGVYLISKGKFSALVHDCIDKPYTDEDPEKIKEMIITHNKILDKAMEDFGGVIPLSFNTIIKRGKNSVRFNLKKWLSDDEERLEKLWNKIKGKKEYGLRIYYDKNKLLEETSAHKEIKKIEKNIEGKSQGLSYLLQGKAKSKKQELFQNKVNELKKEFYDKIIGAVEEIAINPSRISLEEEKDLLLSLSVLVEEKNIAQIREILEKKEQEGFSFQLAGPFAPYSFVEDGKR
ncbi:MAG: GvpL/GvpF family gas vesicle protein [Nanoarchaeota archaeon]